MKGLMRRTHGVHQWDVEVLGEDAADAALGPLRRILSHIDDAIRAGAGTPEQIRDRFAEILDAGRTDYIVLQIPTGDMTFDEAKRTMDCSAATSSPSSRPRRSSRRSTVPLCGTPSAEPAPVRD